MIYIACVSVQPVAALSAQTRVHAPDTAYPMVNNMNNPTEKTKIPKPKSSKLVNSYTQAAQSARPSAATPKMSVTSSLSPRYLPCPRWLPSIWQSLPGCCLWLHCSTGLSPSTKPIPRRVSIAQSQGEYPGIEQRAKREGAEIHWGDETALTNTDVRGRSYAPAGKTPVALTVGGTRQKIFMIATVTNQGKTR